MAFQAGMPWTQLFWAPHFIVLTHSSGRKTGSGRNIAESTIARNSNSWCKFCWINYFKRSASTKLAMPPAEFPARNTSRAVLINGNILSKVAFTISSPRK